MKVTYHWKHSKRPYGVIYSDYVQSRWKSFKTMDEALNFACEQPEWIEGMNPEIVEFAIRTNHKIIHKGGFREFCLR
jgi:hypothetical protein